MATFFPSLWPMNDTPSVTPPPMELQQEPRKYGASGFAIGWTEAAGVVQFAAEGRQAKFVLPFPPQKGLR
jgi:hypothetical protein